LISKQKADPTFTIAGLRRNESHHPMPVLNNISIGGSFAAEIPVFPACLVLPIIAIRTLIESPQGLIFICDREGKKLPAADDLD